MSPAAPRSRPRPRLFIALDTGSLDEALAWVEALAPLKTRGVGLKLGYQFFLSGGFAHARRWRMRAGRSFTISSSTTFLIR